MKKIVLGTAFTLSTIIGGPDVVVAQTVTEDLNLIAILATCQKATPACLEMIQSVIEQIQAADFDSLLYEQAIGALASIVLEAAQETDGEITLFSEVMREIASASSNPEQANAIAQVADLIEEGNADDISAEVLDASPA